MNELSPMVVKRADFWEYNSLPAPTKFPENSIIAMHPLRECMTYKDVPSQQNPKDFHKQTEISLAVSVMCRYWKQINEYYRYSSVPSTSTVPTNN